MGPSNDEPWTGRQVVITHRLRRRRAELGLTQKQVVTRLGRAGLHTTNRAVSSLEHGAGVDVAKLPELAAALNCTVTYLVGLTDDPQRWEPDHPLTPDPADLPTQPDPLSRVTNAAAPATLAPPAQGSRPSWILGLDVPDRRSAFGAADPAR
jgi:transcriptional regulator with XRE-family HTH domain